MASPTIDGHNSAAATGSFAAITLTTTNTNDVIVFAVYNENNSATQRQVSSITGGGLTFVSRGGYIGADPARPGNKVALEFWWAFSAAALTAQSFTITMSGTFDDGVVICFGVNGAFSSSLPWDSNSNIPNTGTGGTRTFSTSEADDLLIAAYGSSEPSNPDANAGPTGWSTLTSNGTGGGALFSSMALYYKSVSATQSAATVFANGNGTPANLAGIVDAITADSVGAAAAAAQTAVTVVSG